MGGAWLSDPNAGTIREFLKLLAVCHTVIPEGEPTPAGIKYQVPRRRSISALVLTHIKQQRTCLVVQLCRPCQQKNGLQHCPVSPRVSSVMQ